MISPFFIWLIKKLRYRISFIIKTIFLWQILYTCLLYIIKNNKTSLISYKIDFSSIIEIAFPLQCKSIFFIQWTCGWVHFITIVNYICLIIIVMLYEKIIMFFNFNFFMMYLPPYPNCLFIKSIKLTKNVWDDILRIKSTKYLKTKSRDRSVSKTWSFYYHLWNITVAFQICVNFEVFNADHSDHAI